MSRPTILVIEDNPTNLELVSDLLEVAGYQLISAQDAETGIQMAEESRPDLVLMDIGLPGMDGLMATRHLGENPLTGHIPVVALTAHAMSGDRGRAMEAGCVGYITKPIDTREFIATVGKFLGLGPE